MLRPRARKKLGEFPTELRIAGTTPVPKSVSIRSTRATEDLSHSTVAVGGDDEDRSRNADSNCVNAQNGVVMELALAANGRRARTDPRDDVSRRGVLRESGAAPEMLCSCFRSSRSRPGPPVISQPGVRRRTHSQKLLHHRVMRHEALVVII